jgi:hypothetical protein
MSAASHQRKRGKTVAKKQSNGAWGLCKDCKWWQIEPKASTENTTMGLCIDEKLQLFLLRVSGNSGCNRFMPGKPATAAGSSKAPPEAAPTR